MIYILLSYVGSASVRVSEGDVRFLFLSYDSSLYTLRDYYIYIYILVYNYIHV